MACADGREEEIPEKFLDAYVPKGSCSKIIRTVAIAQISFPRFLGLVFCDLIVSIVLKSLSLLFSPLSYFASSLLSCHCISCIKLRVRFVFRSRPASTYGPSFDTSLFCVALGNRKPILLLNICRSIKADNNVNISIYTE